MKHVLSIVLLLSLWSCDYFDKKKVYSEDILAEELKTFNWNDVDEYPSFQSCDSTTGKSNRKYCFEQTLRQILNRNLSQHHIVVSEEITDTIALEITIDNQGSFFINTIRCHESTRTQIPQLDSLLRRSLDSLPKIYPAIKRSQEVATQFVLPVIIKLD
ncbi:hypothetical protein ACU8DI_02190 [Psychroserpens sp. BH13MA-6]